MFMFVIYRNIFIYVVVFVYLITPITCYIMQVKCVISEVVIILIKQKNILH